jgi:hypothetical protein
MFNLDVSVQVGGSQTSVRSVVLNQEILQGLGVFHVFCGLYIVGFAHSFCLTTEDTETQRFSAAH